MDSLPKLTLIYPNFFLADQVFLFSSDKTMITSESWKLNMGPETSSPRSPEESMPEFSLAGHDDFELFWESYDDY